jgi:hypothetical protein
VRHVQPDQVGIAVHCRRRLLKVTADFTSPQVVAGTDPGWTRFAVGLRVLQGRIACKAMLRHRSSVATTCC